MSFIRKLFMPSKGTFARKAIEAAKGISQRTTWHYDESSFSLKSDSHDGPKTIDLLAYYSDYCLADRTKRRHIMGDLAMKASIHIPKTFAEAKPHILLDVTNRSFRGRAMIEFGNEFEARFPFEPLCGDMEQTLVYSVPYHPVQICASKLEEWGITEEQAFEAARHNMRDLSLDMMAELRPGFYLSETAEDFGAARMLLTDFLYRHAIKGNPVVMTPHRCILLLTGDRDIEAMREMIEFAAMTPSKLDLLSPQMMRYSDGKWATFTPPELAPHLQLIKVRHEKRNYDLHRVLLTAKCRDNADAPVPSEYKILQNAMNGEVFSASMWLSSQKKHRLLPKTDFVVLVSRATGIAKTVRWDDLQQRCGHMMLATYHLPAHFELNGFPGEADINAIPSAPGIAPRQIYPASDNASD